MNCKQVSDLLSPYLWNELDADRSARVREHLNVCLVCAAEVAQARELDARLRGAILAEPAFAGALEQRIRESIAPRSRRWIGIAASFAAALVMAGIGYRVWTGPDRACTAAADDHQREVVEGARRTWRSDAASIGELAERQGIAAAALSRLAPAGFQLERGKLCRLDGQIFLHLVYSSGSEKLSVFLRQRDASAPADIRNTDAGREHVASFDTQRVTALVVSDQSTESALEAARVAARVL